VKGDHAVRIRISGEQPYFLINRRCSSYDPYKSPYFFSDNRTARPGSLTSPRSRSRHNSASKHGRGAAMKVLILNTLYYPHVRGGAERSVQILAEALAQQNAEVVVASTGDSGTIATAVINNVKVI